MPFPAAIPVPKNLITRISLVSADQRFPSYLKSEFSQLRSLSLNSISFINGEFAPLLKAGHLLPGLANLTSLTLKNISNFPRIVLASCVVLQKLDIDAVRIVEDESRRILLCSATRPQLTALLCKNTEETTLVQLVSIVDLTRLRLFESDMAYYKPEIPTGYLRGPQIILTLCKSTLTSLTLRSQLSMQPPTEHGSMIICDLSQHTVLNHLNFSAWFNPNRDYLHPDIPQNLVIDEVLSTIPWQRCALKKLNYSICVGLDQALKPVTPGGGVRLDKVTPIPFFRNPAWNRFDHTVARLANGRGMRVIINIPGLVPAAVRALYDPQDEIYDSIDMGTLMEEWGRNIFVEFPKAPLNDITVFAFIGPGGLIGYTEVNC